MILATKMHTISLFLLLLGLVSALPVPPEDLEVPGCKDLPANYPVEDHQCPNTVKSEVGNCSYPNPNGRSSRCHNSCTIKVAVEDIEKYCLDMDGSQPIIYCNKAKLGDERLAVQCWCHFDAQYFDTQVLDSDTHFCHLYKYG